MFTDDNKNDDLYKYLISIGYTTEQANYECQKYNYIKDNSPIL